MMKILSIKIEEDPLTKENGLLIAIYYDPLLYNNKIMHENKK